MPEPTDSRASLRRRQEQSLTQHPRRLGVVATIALWATVFGASACGAPAASQSQLAPPLPAPTPVAAPTQVQKLCLTPNLREQERAREALVTHLRADGHPGAEVARVLLIDNDYALAEARFAPASPLKSWRLFTVMHPNPEVPTHWSPTASMPDDQRLLAVATAVEQAAPAGMRLVKLHRGRIKPDRVVVRPVFSNASGAVRNEYRGPFLLFTPRDGDSIRADGWRLKSTMAEALPTSRLQRQLALARHLNAHGHALIQGGSNQRDPRGVLYTVLRHNCAKPGAVDGEAFVLVRNASADPSAWRMQEVDITPPQHSARRVEAQRQALADRIARDGVAVEYHDTQAQLLIRKDDKGALSSGTYGFWLEGNAPLQASSWSVRMTPHPPTNESLTIYQVLSSNFGGAKVRRWWSAHKTKRLIVLEPCQLAKLDCQKIYATSVSLLVKLQEGPERWKRGPLRISRSPTSDPLDPASWTVDEVSLQRIETPAH